jgi:UDP-N-acetylglucosamine acyltransferase
VIDDIQPRRPNGASYASEVRHERFIPLQLLIHPRRLPMDVVIGPYCVIGPKVSIGAGTFLHNHVTVQSLTTIGSQNTIYPYSVIGADPQDRKYHGEESVCIIGDRNSIREQVTIHRGTANGGGETRLGNDNLIMVAAHIAHDCWLGSDICIANQVMLAGHVRIEDGANIGGGAGVHHFATVGSCAFVGGLARITKDVPPFMIVEGNPAEVRAINTIAMMRRGYSPEHIEAVKSRLQTTLPRQRRAHVR